MDLRMRLEERADRNQTAQETKGKDRHSGSNQTKKPR